jgi:hypothetical protein
MLLLLAVLTVYQVQELQRELAKQLWAHPSMVVNLWQHVNQLCSSIFIDMG